ncbi:MAG: hypothetical protein K2X08_04585 [Chlamydiales bacterium]|nr:hypothetical protein [Chlamydiales bacterium]
MSRLFWIIFLFAAYIWTVSSGREEFVLDQGKAICRYLVSWFDDAEVDFQMKKSENKKKPKRWD